MPTKQESQTQLANKVKEQLALLGGKLDHEDDIVFEGTVIKIPSDWTLLRAYELIGKRVRDEEQDYEISRVFKYLPHDGARATARALKEHFGSFMGRAVNTMWGKIPPQLMTIETDYGVHEQVPWGRIALPYFDDGAYLDLMATRDRELGTVFAIQAHCKRKERFSVEGLFQRIEEYLRDDSIYRGKAITASQEPTFIDVSGVDPDDIIYTEDVQLLLATFVWGNILYPQELRDAGQDGKRIIIMHGTYGTGKTEAARSTARICMDELEAIRAGLPGWHELCGFIMVRPGIDNWRHAITLARLYGKCIIFVEDVDTMITDPANQGEINAMLDAVDGLLAKGLDVTLVGTTNHIDKIHKGMLRPGRTDALIELGAMDRPGVEKLARRVIGDALDDETDFDAVFKAMEGFMPAYVKEVFNRTVRYSIVGNKGKLMPIGTHELVHAANGLRPQLDLMNAAPEAEYREGVDGAMTEMVKDVVQNVVIQKLHGAEVRDGNDNYVGNLTLN